MSLQYPTSFQKHYDQQNTEVFFKQNGRNRDFPEVTPEAALCHPETIIIIIIIIFFVPPCPTSQSLNTSPSVAISSVPENSLHPATYVGRCPRKANTISSTGRNIHPHIPVAAALPEDSCTSSLTDINNLAVLSSVSSAIARHRTADGEAPIPTKVKGAPSCGVRGLFIHFLRH